MDYIPILCLRLVQHCGWCRCGCALVQALVSAHPGLVPSGLCDLSAGGALPLHLAAAGGCVDVVHALLAAGAPLEAKDGKGLTALQVGDAQACLQNRQMKGAVTIQQPPPAACSALEQLARHTWSWWVHQQQESGRQDAHPPLSSPASQHRHVLI
jgi:hypothetical protein